MSGLPYRPNVGAVLFNREGLVFVARRADMPNAEGPAGGWQLPQGGIDEGEDPATAVLRERHRTTGPEDDDFTVRTVEEMAQTRVDMANTMTTLLMCVAPDSGYLACDRIGTGRLPAPDVIVAAVEKFLGPGPGRAFKEGAK